MSVALAAMMVAGLGPGPAAAQEVFSATQSANLPTAQTRRSGDWLFEISHRFHPSVADGVDALFGLDGGAFMRLGLAFSPGDGLLLAVQRTNRDDNVELNAKVRLAESADGQMPQSVAALFGAAWDTALDTDRFAYYGQVVWNVRLNEQLALGLVPSYVWRRSFQSLPAQPQDGQFALGAYGQLAVTPSMSLVGEWITANEPSGTASDSWTFGIELETRGHVFKIVTTNQIWMNPTQYLLGSNVPLELDELRLGFNIQRLLPF